MFSTNVIIRNVGGKQYKVLDVGRIQSNGNIRTNTLVNRYQKLHKSNLLVPNDYQATRFQLYNEYDQMDQEALVNQVLNTLADDISCIGQGQEVLTIKSSNEAVDRLLRGLFYDVMNINFNLWSWARHMVKYGDCYLHLSLGERIGVFQVELFPASIVEKEVGYDPANPNAYRYRVGDLTYGTSPYSMKKEDDRYFEPYEIANFTLAADAYFLPYGRSYLEGARKTHKQYVLLKDALLIHQIMRAPEKRTFYVDVGNLPANEITPFMQNFINNVKKIPFIDPETGDYNLRYNLQNANEDYYIPVRGDNMSTRIESTKGLENQGATNVVDLLRDELFAVFGVPKAFMGYEKDLEGKATLAQQDLRFGRTVDRLQRMILSELYKVAYIHLTMHGLSDEEMVNFELTLNTASIVMEQEKIALMKEKQDLAQAMFDSGLFSSDYIYEEIWKMTEEKYIPMRDAILADKRRAFRMAQIENEGNDPNITGKSYGTPHDLAVMYGNERNNTGSTPEIKDPLADPNPEGRPIEYASDYHTQAHPLGKDPLGRQGSTSNVNNGLPPVRTVQRQNPLALSEQYLGTFNGSKYNNLMPNKNIIESLRIKQEEEKSQPNMLSEDNILDF